jgi:hypothetical protein
VKRTWQILAGVAGLCVAAGLLYKHLRGSAATEPRSVPEDEPVYFIYIPTSNFTTTADASTTIKGN